jgi:DNA-binding NarL/FixJ family response regulator
MLAFALVSESGTWAGLTLLREAGRPEFAPSDVELLASLSRYLVAGLRRAVLLANLPTDHQDDAHAAAAGVVLLADDDSIESIDAAAQKWLAELDGGRSVDGHPPSVIRAVAHRARQAAAEHSPGRAAAARLRSASGQWLLARGSVLGNGPDRHVAVIVEAAHRHQLAPLIADACGLTEREQTVTQLIARGLPTDEIARRLYLSPYTVQDHLKAVFAKVGVRSRGELVARLFFDHYVPRMTA